MNSQASSPELTAASEAPLVVAPENVARLTALLSQEFDALKARDVGTLESLQDEKTEILQRLAAVAEWAAGQNPVPTAWQQLQEDLQQCKQDHLRNVQLMQRQLEAVRGTLQSLQGDSTPTLDLYDRMGQMSRRSGAWGYHLA